MDFIITPIDASLKQTFAIFEKLIASTFSMCMCSVNVCVCVYNSQLASSFLHTHTHTHTLVMWIIPAIRHMHYITSDIMFIYMELFLIQFFIFCIHLVM